MTGTMKRLLLLAPLFLATGACGSGTPGAAAQSSTASAGVVDSVFPMPVMLARFRADLTEPASLSGGAASRDALVHRVMDALAANDTMAFEKLSLNRAEFAWLYYPTAPTAQPPYELPPALAWFQWQERNRKGVFRALREFGGRRLDFRGYRCDAQPSTEGENRLWTGCVVTLGRDREKPVTLHLFGAILERDGRFVVLSYQNDF